MLPCLFRPRTCITSLTSISSGRTTTSNPPTNTLRPIVTVTHHTPSLYPPRIPPKHPTSCNIKCSPASRFPLLFDSPRTYMHLIIRTCNIRIAHPTHPGTSPSHMGKICSSIKSVFHRRHDNEETAELRRQIPGCWPSRLSKRFRWVERGPPWLVYSRPPSPGSSMLLQAAEVTLVNRVPVMDMPGSGEVSSCDSSVVEFEEGSCVGRGSYECLNTRF